MGTKRYITTETVVLTEFEIMQEVNCKLGTTFSNLADAIIGAGLSAVGYYVTEAAIASMAGELSVFIGIGLVAEAIGESISTYKIRQLIPKMKDGDRLRVTSRLYEWTAGSGNSSSYIVESTVVII